MLVAVLLLLLVLPLGLTAFFTRSGRSAWGLVVVGSAPSGGTAYRAAAAPIWEEGAAPWVVRFAAATSFLLGQMIVPGALAALVGLVCVVDGMGGRGLDPLLSLDVLSAPTGLAVAWRLLAAGAAMLRRTPDAADKARSAARWSLGHNLVLSAAVVLTCALSEPGQGVIEVGALILAYAAVSIAQALLVRRAAASLDDYSARQRA